MIGVALQEFLFILTVKVLYTGLHLELQAMGQMPTLRLVVLSPPFLKNISSL